MEKIKLYLIGFVLVAASTKLYCQQDSTRQIVYWFPVNIKTEIDKKSKKEILKVKPIGKKPQAGTVLDFEKRLFLGLNGGKKILIGPFKQCEKAQESMLLYNLDNHSDKTMAEEIITSKNASNSDSYFWFFYENRYKKKLRTPTIQRTAARAAFGTLKDFRQVLWEGLSFKQVAIGPFPMQVEAEEAKRLYRLEED